MPYLNKNIFVTGGTGYIGSRLIPMLSNNGFNVTALVRKKSMSVSRLNCSIITGDALNKNTYENYVAGCDTFIHLIGVSHPGPGKKSEFRKVDLVSIEQAVQAALNKNVKHFIYLSVAHPAPVMKDFIEVRLKGEELLRKSGMTCSFIRPWYVLGPGHYWPYLIIPLYKLFELFPQTKKTAQRLGLVKINQLLGCLIHAVKNPPESIAVYNVSDIRNFNLSDLQT